MRRTQRGFTLVELVLAMTLLATMMVLLYAGISFSLRSWDASDANGRLVVDRRIGENFLRRELGELFPMRWKDPMAVKLAFAGEPHELSFVSSRPAGVTLGGLSLVSLEVEEDAVDRRSRNLVMRRAMPDDEARDFGPLKRAEPSILVPKVEAVDFQYFGAENDFSAPQWTDKWAFPGRVPQMVRIRLRGQEGALVSDMVVKIVLGEEAGCLESSFQRYCRPRAR